MATKKFFIALFCILSFAPAFAENKDLEKDITMVSYEQSWLDYQGTIALKNNTSDVIHNIVFQLTYLDMAGNEMDYAEFAREIMIDPGKTKKLDIPAYEHSRHYHYYKTKDALGYPTFKIKFQLKDYNVENIDEDEDEDYYSDNYDDESSSLYNGKSHGGAFFVLFIFLLIFLGIYVGLYVLVAVMAKKRNRNVVLWVLLSLVATPLLMIIILLAIGKEDDPTERHSF